MRPPSDIAVRPYEPRDLPDLHEAWSQPRAVFGTLLDPAVSAAEREKRFANPPPGMAHFVALVEGKAVGSASLHRQERHRRSHAGDIGMAVHDAYAGRGVGTALLAALVDLADNWWNLRRIELDVYADNARAIALYERFGFEREGLRRAFAWRDGGYVDSLSMARLRL